MRCVQVAPRRSLAFWVERSVWLVGLGVIGIGLVWHLTARRIGTHDPGPLQDGPAN